MSPSQAAGAASVCGGNGLGWIDRERNRDFVRVRMARDRGAHQRVDRGIHMLVACSTGLVWRIHGRRDCGLIAGFWIHRTNRGARPFAGARRLAPARSKLALARNRWALLFCAGRALAR